MEAPSPKELRKLVFDWFLETGRAPLLEEIMHRYEASREEAAAWLSVLQDAHHLLLLPGTQRILMANPFSSLPTPFRVSVGSKEYFANCAWDAIAFHVMLNRDLRVSSLCHHCGDPIVFELHHGKTSESGRRAVVFLGTPVSRWYDNLVMTCSNTMVFFAGPDHLTGWQNGGASFEGARLTVDQMIQVVTPISRGRATLEYEMPSKIQLMSHWKSIGLDGPFWTF
ncbi:MAG: alkylmercury lyase family protein [Thermoplasmata archaeon]|nr:alkylmercury lyase family protein [Thermoplasmata archaeon]